MSSISVEIPVLRINADNLKNLISFIYKHEELLKQFGAIKLQMNSDCRLALKKRRKNLLLPDTNKRIVKMSANDHVYSIQTSSEQHKKTYQKDLIVTDECSFWSSLHHSIDKERYLNSVTVPNASFFTQKTSRLYFDIHRLPNQSLLKIGGTEFTRQFNPYVRRSLKAGAIFPLTSSPHNLYTIDYHHEGGDHHWYFIPNCERPNLRQALHLENSSICLDHEQLFIDPFVLEKNCIRYHSIVQQPREFIIMAPGTLAQGFTNGASWNESINFALPNWILDGHATNTSIHYQCDTLLNSVPKIIDLNLFRDELIEKYISSFLDINNNEGKARNFVESIDKTIPQNNNGICYSKNLITDELTIPSSVEIDVTPPPTTVSTLYTSPLSLMAPSIDSVVFDEGKTHTHESDFEETFHMETLDAAQTNCTTNDLPLNEITSMYAIIQDNSTTNNCNINNKLFPMEELLDLLPLNSANIQSYSKQVDEFIKSTELEDYRTNRQERNYLKNKNIPDERRNDRRTLFLSGLQANINVNAIRKYFIGSTKVTMKRYRTTSYLKYAFVAHRTYQDAQRNLYKFINSHPFGSQCQAEFVKNNSNKNNEQKNKIMVNRIPYNVTRNDLHNLFVDCRIIEYYPARVICSESNKSSIESDTQILWGYATLLYDNEQLAAAAIEHTDQYKIDGQQLTASLYCNKKSKSTH